MSKPAVLFLCTGNSARSQMAEALLRKYGEDRFAVHSAGVEPKGIHPLTVRVMEEAGVSLDEHRSKSLTEYLGKIPIRFVIVVCEEAEKRCPSIWPFGATVLFWPFDDPAAFEGSPEACLDKFRSVRDRIEEKIKSWLKEIDG